MSPVLSTALRTADQIKDNASHTRESALELGVQALKLLNTMRYQQGRAFDVALEHVGLQRREGPLRPIAFFVAGAAVAGCAVLVLAPSSGKKIRAQIVDALRTTRASFSKTARDSSRSEDGVMTSASEPSPKTSNGDATHAGS